MAGRGPWLGSDVAHGLKIVLSSLPLSSESPDSTGTGREQLSALSGGQQRSAEGEQQ